MSLTLVLGPANSAKAGEVLAAYTNAARRDAVLVVPTAADAAHYDRELAGQGVVLGRAMTFAGLIGEIARRVGFDVPRLTSLQRQRLLRRTIAGLDLPVLRESARASGFPAAAGRLLAELAGARVGAPRFAAALRSWASPDPSRAGYASDLAAIYLAYTRALEATGRVDAERAGTLALDATRAEPSRWGATPVYFYGFDDLTRIERDAIDTLAHVADAPVTVSLTYEPGRYALAARASVVEELRAHATTVLELPPLSEHYEAAALHHVERRLFEPSPERIDPGGTVVLLEAGGERAEAELIAAEVLTARRQGVAAEEIVVVCRSLARSGALLEDTLRRYGVACASARTVPLIHTSLGRALLALGRCAVAPAELTDAQDLLAYLRAPGRVEDPSVLDQLEATVRRRGLRTVAQARAVAPFSVPEIDILRTAGDPGTELARQARLLLAAPLRRTAAELSPEERLDARAATAVIEAVDEIHDLGDAPTGIEWLEVLEGLEVDAGDPAGADTVLVAEPLAIRARRFRWVFVTGLCEGEFPGGGGSDPFLDEERRRELAIASGLILAPPPDALARERYLLYACVSRATERLVLSYRSADEDGHLVMPSPFLADIGELFVPEWRDRRRRRLLADVVWPPQEAPTARELALSAAASGLQTPTGESSGDTRRLGETALRHVRHRQVVSGGALESFARCPVGWLVESQLSPCELAPDGEPLTRGTFMHDVLEKVIASIGGPITPLALPAAEARLEELVGVPPDDFAPGRPPAVRAALLRGIAADLRRYLRHEASDGCEGTPHALELRFGFDDEPESLPSVVLGDGDDRVVLRGVIDRIDVSAGPSGVTQAVVRDYKSGANRPERAGARWRQEHQLQVGLYLIAVRQLLAMEPAGGFFQPLTGRELRPRGAYRTGVDVGRFAYSTDSFEPEAFDELLSDIEAQAVEIAATLRRGELTPCPETCSRDGCRHPGICWAG